MIVEDDQEVRSFNCEILQSLGYRVFDAPDGIEALKLIEIIDQTIDLVISDVVMPKMRGRELANKISEKYPKIKVLFISGYSDNQIAQNGILISGIHFLQKPYSIEKLAKKVREILDKK